jgi:hypothetical protein
VSQPADATMWYSVRYRLVHNQATFWGMSR